MKTSHKFIYPLSFIGDNIWCKVRQSIKFMHMLHHSHTICHFQVNELFDLTIPHAFKKELFEHYLLECFLNHKENACCTNIHSCFIPMESHILQHETYEFYTPHPGAIHYPKELFNKLLRILPLEMPFKIWQLQLHKIHESYVSFN